ncbi:sensor histidine kinase [Reichenbachiella versicolor]|uniref:sensor histidine kinase n=1 Tax=Reichenbachiella versicolor TaxID=1821036 RepID=UPI000D6E649B|nr:histidine kinase [Reichenbachiella versicolor]
MIRDLQIVKDKRYAFFYLFTAVVIATLLAIEELTSGDYTYLEEVFQEFLTDVPVFFLVTIFISLVGYGIIKLLNQLCSWEKDSLRRFFYEIMIVILLVAIFTVITNLIDRGEEDNDEAKFLLLTILLYFIDISMIFAFHEYMALNADKQAISTVAKDLERQNVMSQFEALKNQVNPHFLFNCLNVLSSLIYKDIDLSDKFIRKFSEVFRYLLELNTGELVSLRKEVGFIESYIFLQKIRHGDCILVDQNIREEDMSLKIPPMALQIVVENAFKHNIISDLHPLTIKIFSKDGRLMIKNNFQLRTRQEDSIGIGQRNLLNRYKIMGTALPDFYIEETDYVAELPLIN